MQDYLVEFLSLGIISFLIGRFSIDRSRESESFFDEPEPNTLCVKIMRDHDKFIGLEFVKKGQIDLSAKIYGDDSQAVFYEAERQLKSVLGEIERASKT